MNPKETIVAIVTAMVVMTMFASSAMAINVDGDCSEWTNDWVANDPPDDPVGIGGYDLKALHQHYEGGTVFIMLEVYGTPGDLDENGNPDTVCDDIPPGDCIGVGPYEQYTIVFTSPSKPGVTIMYTNNAAAHADGAAAHGASCVEFSLSNANNYINPYDYCMNVTAGGMADIPGEDVMCVCYNDTPPTAVCSFTPTVCGQGTLSGTGSSDDGTIVEYAWDFGNDGSYDDYGEIVTYNTIGTHDVRLMVTDDAGQTANCTLSATVTGGPVAVAKADGDEGPTIRLPAGGKTVEFSGTGSYHPDHPDAEIVSHAWVIGGKTYDQCTVSLFIGQDTTAKLTVTDNFGCKATDTITLRVPPQAVPILTLPGLLALIGMLCIVGAGRIFTRGRRS